VGERQVALGQEPQVVPVELAPDLAVGAYVQSSLQVRAGFCEQRHSSLEVLAFVLQDGQHDEHIGRATSIFGGLGKILDELQVELQGSAVRLLRFRALFLVVQQFAQVRV